jgi:hypothetical protein
MTSWAPVLIVRFEEIHVHCSYDPAIWVITKENLPPTNNRLPLGYHHLHGFHNENSACKKLMKLASQIAIDHPEWTVSWDQYMMEDANDHLWRLGVFFVTDKNGVNQGVYKLVRVVLDDQPDQESNSESDSSS